jgi:hypothetical protein
MSRHTVKIHKWHEGRLATFEHAFVSLDEAYKFASSAEGHIVKVYDRYGQVVHSVKDNNLSVESYA